MKGLLRKDLYMIWRYARMLLVISAVFLVMGILAEENTFFVVYPVLFGGVLPVTLISYEERDGWNALCDTMPISRKTVVNERFLMTVLCFLVLYLITLGVQGAVLLSRGRAGELAELACLLPGIGLLAPALMIPVTLRWGVEKGRLAYYVFIGLVVFLALTSANAISGWQGELLDRGLWALPAAAAAVFVLSWRLSLRIYERREL